MVNSFAKKIKRGLCVACAGVTAALSAFAFSACQSSWPKVTINIDFNGKSYSLVYRLYGKFFPQTVKHFTELAEKGFYDGLCVHDYASEGMYTGGYTYNAETQTLTEQDYFGWAEENTLTQSVFAPAGEDGVPTRGLNTLVGEFSANNYEIENNDKKYGSKKEGALVMYYYTASNVSGMKDSTQNVSVKRTSKRTDVEGEARWYDYRSYMYNSATSLFYISASGNGSSVESNYCVFGELYNEDAEEKYDELTAAIEKYMNDNALDEDEFVEKTTKAILTEDPYYNELIKATFDVPVEPIVIKSVKVNRK